ncbi:enoyl-CoA hydratase [Rhodococcus erythropolis]|uniref:crotonase/enoyl-CoA hydratase family protein n=1 Tax=Rhodococcus erythropolis TaxID=1833 RepID=UPI00216844EE|nr:crotonase/enoyl-CoA hydratase family protein [Rhodococcus erythropolis]MCS4255987.1 enoyl-CoA hydratase [Rhodococcus erythropolis]MCW2425503.1 enoyl-CoA hydratase [Rhodococcus erythropolis]
MNYTCFTVEIDNSVAHIQLSRPSALNTMIPEFWTELPQLVHGLSDTGNIRAAIISSTGPHFSAGLDLSTFSSQKRQRTSDDAGRANLARRERVLSMQRAFTALEDTRMPILAAIHGGCIGGGLALATACDMRFATTDAFFVVQETNIGLAADTGTLQRLPRLVPDGIARELAYTGGRLDAPRAQEIGLVNQVYADHNTMLTAVTTMAHTIATKNPLAIWGSKNALNYARSHGTDDGLHQIANWSAAALAGSDIAASLNARQEKRTPTYPDLPCITPCPAPR